MNTRSTTTVLGGIAVTATILAGCGSTEGSEPTAEVSGVREEASQTDYPVEIENCGRTVTIESPPERVVSAWPTSTELMIELGVEDRLVGQYNVASVGEPRAEYAEAFNAVEVIAEAAPSREALLAADPDLIWADGEYLFDGQQLPTIEELESSGIQVLTLAGTCTQAGASSLSNVEEDLDMLGLALGISEDTDALKADVAAELATLTDDDGGNPVDAAMISTFEGTVFTFEGVYSDMLAAAGGRNLLDGTLPDDAYFGELSVEQLTAADPGTLVYLMSGDTTEDEARAQLQESYPTVAAVRDDRLVFMDEVNSTNLRTVDGVEQLSEQLAALG